MKSSEIREHFAGVLNYTGYENFCQERGINPVAARKALTSDQVAVITKFEQELPDRKKQIAEWETKLKEQETVDAIKNGLQLFVAKEYPVSKIKNEFAGLHDGWCVGIANTMYEAAQWELNPDGTVGLKGQKPDVKPQPKNELERILESAKIDFTASEEKLTMAGALLSAVRDKGKKFLK